MHKWRVMAIFLDALLTIVVGEMVKFKKKGPKAWQAHLEAVNNGKTNRQILYDTVIERASVSQSLQLTGFTLISSAGLSAGSASACRH